MNALLQLIGKPPDDQIATEAQRRSGVMQCPPGTPQLRCRPIDQPGDCAINLGQVLVVEAGLFGRRLHLRLEDGSPECWRPSFSAAGGEA